MLILHDMEKKNVIFTTASLEGRVLGEKKECGSKVFLPNPRPQGSLAKRL
jgi:hypothetical protein